MTNDITDEVKSIGSLNFEGNIIPIEWYSYLRLPNNKPDLVSIILLSEIVYWYRPTTIRDEFSGKIIGYKKKFKSDLLQKSYNDLEDLFGLTKDQIKKSLQRLEQLNLIKRIFRHINSQGSSLANVMFIQIFPEQISKITEKTYDMSKNTHTSEHSYPGICVNKTTHTGKYTHTYTENTTKITTNNSLSLKNSEKNKNNFNKSKEERENKMLKIWNEIVEVHFNREIKLTPKRKILLKSRLGEYFENNLSSWTSFCMNITKSDFLMGRVKDFKVSLDWILKEDSIIKVIEGNYHNTQNNKNDKNAEIEYINSKHEEQKILKELEKTNTPKFWQEMMKALLKDKGITTFNSWFKKNDYLNYENGILKVKAPSKFFAQWQKDHFFDDMIKACQKNIDNFRELEILC